MTHLPTQLYTCVWMCHHISRDTLNSQLSYLHQWNPTNLLSMSNPLCSYNMPWIFYWKHFSQSEISPTPPQPPLLVWILSFAPCGLRLDFFAAGAVWSLHPRWRFNPALGWIKSADLGSKLHALCFWFERTWQSLWRAVAGEQLIDSRSTARIHVTTPVTYHF